MKPGKIDMTSEIWMAIFAAVGILAWLADKVLFPESPKCHIKKSKNVDIDDDVEDSFIMRRACEAGYVGPLSEDIDE